MQTLFPDSETFQKNRPEGLTAAQEAEFYLKMAKEIIADGFSNDDEESIILDLKELFPFNDNGYEMAKELEGYRSNASYEIDTSFCEWLDGLHSNYDSYRRKNVRDWVKAHNPQPLFQKGTKLIINELLSRELTKGMIVYVTGVRTEEAYYWIDANPERNGGYVLAYERVEKCSSIVEPAQVSDTTMPPQ